MEASRKVVWTFRGPIWLLMATLRTTSKGKK